MIVFFQLVRMEISLHFDIVRIHHHSICTHPRHFPSPMSVITPGFRRSFIRKGHSTCRFPASPLSEVAVEYLGSVYCSVDKRDGGKLVTHGSPVRVGADSGPKLPMAMHRKIMIISPSSPYSGASHISPSASSNSPPRTNVV